jgi:hypothetical protein
MFCPVTRQKFTEVTEALAASVLKAMKFQHILVDIV